MTQQNRPGSGPLLDARQISELRNAVGRELGNHPEWADLWNLHGLLEAHEGNLEAAASKFSEAVRRNAEYLKAQDNLEWVEALTSTSKASRRERSPSSDAAGAIVRVVRNLVAGVDPGNDWPNADPSLSFFALTLAAARAPERVDECRGRLAEAHAGVGELLEAAGLERDGRPSTQALRMLGHPDRMCAGFSDLLLRAAQHVSIAGDEKEARRLQALAALYSGDRTVYLVERGETASRHGKTDEALSLLREAAELQPENHRTRVALGYELSLQGLRDDALHHMEAAVRLEPRYADLPYQLGLLLHAAGRNDDAIAAMEQALHVNPEYVVARIALANLLFDASRPAQAAPHYERVLEEGMETPTLAGRFGYSLHAAGNRNRAEELFLEAIARHNDKPELLALYGQFLAETDRRIEALAVWDRALASDPPDWVRSEVEIMKDEVAAQRRGEGR